MIQVITLLARVHGCRSLLPTYINSGVEALFKKKDAFFLCSEIPGLHTGVVIHQPSYL